jgi:hypothetical protein
MAGVDVVVVAYPLLISVGCAVAAYLVASRRPSFLAKHSRRNQSR